MELVFNGVVDTQGERQSLSTLGGFSFEDGKVYSIQIAGHTCTIGFDSSEGGFVIDNSIPFRYNSDGSDLYIKTNGRVSVNIEG